MVQKPKSPAHFINEGVINVLARRYFYMDAWEMEQPLLNWKRNNTMCGTLARTVVTEQHISM